MAKRSNDPSTTTFRTRPAWRAVPAAVALALLSLGAAACQTPPSAGGGGSSSLLCRSLSQHSTPTPVAPTGVLPPTFPPDIDFSNVDGHIAAWGSGSGYEADPWAEQVSPNGQFHVWAVAEQDSIGFGSPGTRYIHIYAQDTASGDAPEQVYLVGHFYHLWGTPDPLGTIFGQNTDGWPTAISVESVADDGSGAEISVTYGTELRGDEGSYVDAPFQAVTFEVGC